MGEGIVYIVGAGPGDPGLLTVKGFELLASADTVVFDHLADDRMLAVVPADAETHDVRDLKQAEVTALLLRLAREGRHVVRLKDGDPFVYSSGVEEALALAEAGVSFEVVPGVTAAVGAAACAGIPLIAKGVSEDLAFACGHPDLAATLPWSALAAAGTLCVYVAHRSLAETAARLVAEGRDATTPAALLRDGSTPRQAVLGGTLGDIAERAAAEGFGKRYLLVAGDTVRLRERLRWFEDRPLFGVSVVVTRARAQALELVERLAELGAEVLEFPTIATAEPEGWGPADAAIARLASYDWAVFTSVNAVDTFMCRVDSADLDARALAGLKVAAVGPATAERLTNWGIKADVVPDEHVAEGLLEALVAQGAGAGTRLLFPRALEAREVLPETLRGRGAVVDVVPVYRTVLGPGDPKVLERLHTGTVDAVTFASSSSVRNFLELAEGADVRGEDRPLLASIGPATSATARKLGLTVDVEAAEYTIGGLLDALVARFAPRS